MEKFYHYQPNFIHPGNIPSSSNIPYAHWKHSNVIHDTIFLLKTFPLPSSSSSLLNFLTCATKHLSVTLAPRNILTRLYLSALNSRQQHLNAFFVSDIFINRIPYPSILDTLSTSTLSNNHRPLYIHYSLLYYDSARFVTASNAVCSKTGIFSHYGISRKYLILSNTTDPIIISPTTTPMVHIFYELFHLFISFYLLNDQVLSPYFVLSSFNTV